ncbi:MAG: FlgO family outer membrane protein [Limisphaerales bacterium]
MVASESGTANSAVNDALLSRFKSADAQIVPSFFKPAFVSDGLFDTAFAGSSDLFDKLELSKSLDGLLLAREKVQYAANPSLENVINRVYAIRGGDGADRLAHAKRDMDVHGQWSGLPSGGSAAAGRRTDHQTNRNRYEDVGELKPFTSKPSMNTHRILAAILSIAMCCHALAQDMDTELYNLTEKLAAQIKEHGNKKITVLDFTDLEGRSNELGKYIAEQLTVDFVMAKRDFSVLDRANLKKILAEHKLTATGLIDPENAKKLGMFAGVDALVLGTIIPKGTNISLTAKIITTETAEIVGAAKAVFKVDETVQHLAATAHTEGQTDDTASDLNAERTENLKIIRRSASRRAVIAGFERRPTVCAGLVALESVEEKRVGRVEHRFERQLQGKPR